MNADIQRARDVLAKWRSSSTLGPWRQVGEGDVGTAGNPELLDAIDRMLDVWKGMRESTWPSYVRQIVPAIIAADERMSA